MGGALGGGGQGHRGPEAPPRLWITEGVGDATLGSGWGWTEAWLCGLDGRHMCGVQTGGW